jgi:RNase P subunit RPR2
LKWQAAEQIKLAAIEKAYAERVRELTRREMELAQSEFAKARHMWQRAREEVEKAESMKEKATRKIDSTCMEITCQSCRQRLKP